MRRSSRFRSSSTKKLDKVTVIGPVSPYRGGIALHTDQLVRELRKRGLNVNVESWAHQYPPILFKGFRPGRADRVELPFINFRLSWWNPVSWVSAGLRNRGRKFILIGVTPFQYPIFLCLLKFGSALFTRRSVLVAHNVTPHETSIFDRALTSLFFRCIGTVLTHSEPEREMACRYRGEARLAKLPYHGPRWDAELPPFRRTDRILFLGYVRDYKGLDLLIEALSKSEEMPALVVAGEFWQPVSKFRELAEKHRVAERVEFRPGFVDETDLLALLDQVDLLVLPYKSATATQLPALARTRKTPTIVTPVGELANSVEHMKNGIVASQVTADAIAQAIASAYNSDLLRALSENCSPPDERLEWDLYLKALLEE